MGLYTCPYPYNGCNGATVENFTPDEEEPGLNPPAVHKSVTKNEN